MRMPLLENFIQRNKTMTKVVSIKKNKQTVWKIEGEGFQQLQTLKKELDIEQDRLRNAAKQLQDDADKANKKWWSTINKIIGVKDNVPLSLEDSFVDLGFYIVKKQDRKHNPLQSILEALSE